MRHLWIIILFPLLFSSCKEEELQPVEFRIKAVGFVLEDAFGEAPVFSSPEKHRLSAGSISFNTSHTSNTFETGPAGLEEYSYTLPPGEYQVELSIPPASIYGQASASFTADRQAVVIDAQTDTITLEVRATCSQFVVYDQSGQLENGAFMIERYDYASGYFIPHPLQRDSSTGHYYTYFTPDPDSESPSAFLWFYDEEPGQAEGGLSTVNLYTGKRYHINILE